MQQLVEVLRHHERNPGLYRLRHPLVVLFHLPFIGMLLLWYVLMAEHTLGQVMYIIVTVGLYLSSAAYHAWRPVGFVRFADQTFISWYVIVTPLPLIYMEPWALEYTIGAMALSAVNKWRGWESSVAAGSAVFFALGAISTSLALFVGLPVIGETVFSATGAIVVCAVGCFVAKLVIYHFQKLRLVPGIWESPESGHFVLSVGVMMYTGVVLTNPV